MTTTPRSRLLRRALPAALACLAAWCVLSAPAQELPAKLKQSEAERVAVIEKVRPSVVAVFSAGGNGGGSGVLIDEEGYALTNFHVTAGSGTVMKCGLPDGVLYDGVLVGHDKVGDVALIKLLPKKPGQKFPFAPLGDSDKLRAGDWSLAMGNPFLLATDFTPTVTYGLISGVHRYQYPEGSKGLLEYTDCIQMDTSINPGNSGGPLFNMKGELIGINGRGSFDKRTRINSGVGYAVSINQIKNFLGHLRAGLDTDHASLGAIVESDNTEGEGANPKMVVKSMLENSDVARRGLDIDAELVAFAGRPMTSLNQYKNVMGLFPRGWRVPLTYRLKDEKKEVLVRLMGVQRQEIEDDKKPKPPPGPRPAPRPVKPSPASKLFEAREGYANYYFNKLERKKLWDAFVKQQGDFTGLKGEWTLTASKGEADNRPSGLEATIKDAKDEALVKLNVLAIDYDLKPLGDKTAKQEMVAPPKSGGLISALYQWRRLLAEGEKGFPQGDFTHGGTEPFYLPPAGAGKPDYEALKVMAEVLRTRYAGVAVKWYFAPKDKRLLGFEATIDKDEDPCEVFFSDYKKVDGRMLPQRIRVRHAGEAYADFTDVRYKLSAK